MEFETLPDGRRIAPRRPGDPEDCDAVEMPGPGACDGCVFFSGKFPRNCLRDGTLLACLKGARGPEVDFFIVFEQRKTYGNEEE